MGYGPEFLTASVSRCIITTSTSVFLSKKQVVQIDNEREREREREGERERERELTFLRDRLQVKAQSKYSISIRIATGTNTFKRRCLSFPLASAGAHYNN